MGWAAIPACAAAAVALWAAGAARAQPGRPSRPELTVDIGFPGGSAEVVRVDPAARVVRVRPSAHPDRGWRCWWYFRLAGIEPNEPVTIEVEGDVWCWPVCAAVSLDDETWALTEPGRRAAKGPLDKADATAYRATVAARQAWFAWGPPYLPRHADALVAAAEKACAQARGFELCRTREGRPVPALRIARPAARQDERRLGVWIQARQHAWESGSSWVCHGLAEWAVSDDPRAAMLRSVADLAVVPIMDVDNVVRGAGGKNQKPQDHNRDWSDQPHWPSVRAAQREIAALDAAGRFDVFVDLHNPAAGDREPFFYLPPPEELCEVQRRNLQAFLAAAKADITGPLAFRGQMKVSGKDYDRNYKQISKNWVSDHTGKHVAALTLETSWNTPASTRDNYRQVGRGLGLAIERYLREGRRP